MNARSDKPSRDRAGAPQLTVHSAVEIVPIRGVAANRERLERDCFTVAEKDALVSRPDRTAAGLYAVKKALVSLLGARPGMENLSERSFVLKRRAGGAPFLSAVAEPFGSCLGGLRGRIHVSVSHTRENAYGLAVLQELADG